MTCLLGAIPAWADDYEPKTFPNCHIYLVNGKTVCGYADINDWKLVLKSDAELVFLRNKVRFMEEYQSNLEAQLRSSGRQLELASQQAILLAGETDRLTEELVALDKKYQDERVKPRWGSWLAWSVAGVSTAALAGILLFSAAN